MLPALRHRALYASFDRFPSRKGSAVHIDRFARALFEQAGGGLLYVLGGDGLPAYQREGDVEVVRYMREADHVLERAAGFGVRLATLLSGHPSLRLAHFRDPWSGVPIVEHPDRSYVAVYEVNGLPSIELPFLYPSVPPGILERVAALEQRCLDAAELVITPSHGHRRAAEAARGPRRAPARRPQRRRRPPARSTAATRPAARATSSTSARCSRGRASTPRCAPSPNCAISTTSTS